MYLPWNASKARLREAANAQKNRLEIVEALSHGKVSRRDLMKWGVFTAAGLLVPKSGLSPFAKSAYADSNIPTGLPPSPLFGVKPFTQPMLRFDVLPRKPVAWLDPYPTEQANTTMQRLDDALVGSYPTTGNPAVDYYGPIEGRPPGELWAHQRWDHFFPSVAIEVTQEGAKDNTVYNPGVLPSLNNGFDPATTIPLKFHPGLPTQDALAVWTFNGTIPPKLAMIRYGEPVLFRHHNKLPYEITKNRGFGRHTITTHKHNAHHGAENDGFTGAYFYPGQFYDYHWPICHAGYDTINADATDPRCGGPDDSGGVNKCAGDWRETMSTHWFHDHMFSFTAQNVYKGNAAMCNIYSSLDRGNEEINDGVSLRLPSGTAKSWGNLDYDVNLLLADKAWDADGQLHFDIFDFDGFLGDMMTVNLQYKPYFEVERRKYRFRILNGAVSRFFKVAIADASGKAVPLIQIANDGNLLPQPVVLTALDEQGIAERYDIVVDFSRYKVGDKLWMVNLCEHQSGTGPSKDRSLSDALAGKSADPCVGKFLEFRIVRDPARPDVSQVASTLIPNPDLSKEPVVRQRTFEFGKGAKISFTPSGSANDQDFWGVKTDNGDMLGADYGRISAAPKAGQVEIWTLKNGGGGWDHPVHIHFEEGQILARNGSAANVPAWERGRKDVYRLRPSGSVTVKLRFREFAGTFVEHCHNTQHEDHAMLLRWDPQTGNLQPLPTPMPKPQGVDFIESNTTDVPTAF